MHEQPVNRATTMSEGERNQLLDALDGGSLPTASAKGGAPRVSYRQTALELMIWHPGGSTAVFEVASRNLGADGLTILHSGYIHRGTKCRIGLSSVWKTREDALASVRNCVHVQGLLHESDLRFESGIDLRRFVKWSPALSRVSPQSCAPSRLSGSVLLIDDQEIEERLLRVHLRQTRIELTAVRQAGTAMDLVKKRPFDLVLCDWNLGAEQGEAAVRALRGARFAGPILVVTGDPNVSLGRLAKDAGANAVLSKPWEREKLTAALAEWLNSAGTEGEAETFHSSLYQGEKELAGDIVPAYIEWTKRVAHSLTKAIDADDAPEARTICITLKETGAAAGFDEITKAAAAALAALDASSSVQESLVNLSRLRAVLGRLRDGVAEPADGDGPRPARQPGPVSGAEKEAA